MYNEDKRSYGTAIALVLCDKGKISEAQKNELQSPGYTDQHNVYHERGLWEQVFCSVYKSEQEAKEDFARRGF